MRLHLLGLLATGLILLTPAVPARAGSYECIDLDASGSVTVGSMTYPLEQPSCATTSVSGGGSIAYRFSATYKFIWVADPQVNGADDPQAEQRSLDYTGTLNWSLGSGYGGAGGCSGQWSLSVTSPAGTSSTSWSASMTSTPNLPNPPSIQTAGTWGENSGQLTYTLSGMEPTVTLDFEGDLTATGTAGGSLALQAPAPGAPGAEGIWHTYPVQGKSYPVSVNLTPTGRWRGNTGNTYRIRFARRYLNPQEVEEILEPNTGDLVGNNRAQNWTGNAFAPINLLKHWSVAYLDKKVGTNQYSRVKTSDIHFNGAN